MFILHVGMAMNSGIPGLSVSLSTESFVGEIGFISKYHVD